MKKGLVVVFSVFLLVVTLLAAFYILLILRAERLPDRIEIDLTLMYDCVKQGRIKGDQVYVHAGGREGCGVPLAKVDFMRGDQVLLSANLDEKGKYRNFLNDRIDHPLVSATLVRFKSHRCGENSFVVTFDKQHRFVGESMARRYYTYRSKQKFMCRLRAR